MKIKVIYFASLREKIGRGEDTIEAKSTISALEAWTLATGQSELPDNVLIAINHEYVSADSLLNENDELAFFPPVTGG